MSKPEKNNLKILYFVKPLALPILLAMLPSLYHYSNNVAILTLFSLSKMLIFNMIIAILIFLVFMVIYSFRTIQAANATFVFLVFFNSYGLVYKYLLKLDIIRIEHYTLLPFMLMLTTYSTWIINKIGKSISMEIWKYPTLILGILVFF
jgi:hypothetical protein